MRNRMLAIVLCICMLFGTLTNGAYAAMDTLLEQTAAENESALAQLFGLTGGARPDPAYHRLKPEAAILNRKTGENTTGSSSFYSRITMEATASSSGPLRNYNALDLRDLSTGFVHTSGEIFDSGENRSISPMQTVSGATLEWGSFADSVIAELGKQYYLVEREVDGSTLSVPMPAMDFALSATFYNRWHKHDASLLKDIEVLAYESINFKMGSGTKRLFGSSMDTVEYPYLGKDEWTPFQNNAVFDGGAPVATMSLNTSRVKYKSVKLLNYDYYCECGGSYCTDFCLVLRDSRAPSISGITYAADGSTEYKNASAPAYLKEGQTLTVKVEYDEPIRFADDSAAGKGELYINLMPEGVTEPVRAYLTRLEHNALYFDYTVKAGDNVRILGVGTSPLTRTDDALPLVQVRGSGSFSIEDYVKDDSEGFTSTTAYITDLSGNPIPAETKAGLSVKLDTVSPTVESVAVAKADYNNNGLNEWLSTETGYINNSELWLGQEDSVSLKVTFSEVLAENHLSTATLTTNLHNAENQAVTMDYLYHTESGGKTVVVFQTAAITAGLTVPGETGEIAATALSFTGDVADPAGNVYAGGEQSLPCLNMPELDVSPPALTPVTDGGYMTVAEDGDTITITPHNEGVDGFSVAFALSDTGSGAEGLPISFALRNSYSTDYTFQYIVKYGPEKPGEAEWAEAATGTLRGSNLFTSAGNGSCYIHIRTLDKGTNDTLGGFKLHVAATDYAGNNHHIYSHGLHADNSDCYDLNWGSESAAPYFYVSGVDRAYDSSSGTGTLTATVAMVDNRELKSGEYAWSDSGETAPENHEWIPAWQAGAEPVATASFGASFTAANGISKTQYLWARATDRQNNQSRNCVGSYTYDLRPVTAELTYADYATVGPKLGVKIPFNCSSLFLVRDMDDAAAGEPANTYWGWRKDGPYPYISNILPNSGWVKYTVTGSDGVYTLTHMTDAALGTIMSDILTLSPSYTGELNVWVMTGSSSAFTSTDTGLTAGDDSPVTEQSVSLRSVSPNFNALSGVTSSYINPEGYDNYASGYANRPTAKLRSTLEGAAFGLDASGCPYWNSTYLDFSTARIELRAVYRVSDDTESHVWYMGEEEDTYSIPIGSADSQTVVFPAGDYGEDTYMAWLVVPSREGTVSYERMLRDDAGRLISMQVDRAEAQEDQSLDSIAYTPESPIMDYADFYGPCPYGGNWDDALTVTPSEDQAFHLPVMPQSKGAGEYIMNLSFTNTAASGEGLYDGSNTVYLNYGQGHVLVWNTAVSTGGLRAEPTDALHSYDGAFAFVNTSEEAATATLGGYGEILLLENTEAWTEAYAQDGDKVPLFAGVENTIAVQLVYNNGSKSAVKLYTVIPETATVMDMSGYAVNNDETDTDKYFTLTPDGAYSDALAAAGIGPVSGSLVLTPKADLTGLRVYAACEDGDGTVIQREMELREDGSYTCLLTPGLRSYYIHTVDQYGGVNLFARSLDGSGFPRPFPLTADGEDPAVTVDSKNMSYGVYTVKYKIDDNTVLKDGEGNLLPGWSLWVSLRCAASGIDEDAVYELTLDSGLNQGPQTWTADGSCENGIFEVTKEYTGGSLYVTVKGIRPADQLHRLTASVTDVYGNTGTSTVPCTSADTVSYTCDGYEAELSLNGVTYMGRHLRVSFYAPVLPVDSWICQKNAYQYEHNMTFPVTRDGTAEIAYYDIFGSLRSQTISLTDVYTAADASFNAIDRGAAVTLSETGETGEPVTVTVDCSAQGNVAVFIDGDSGEPLGGNAARSASVTVEQNCTVMALIFRAEDYAQYGLGTYEQGGKSLSYAINWIPIHISNIAKSAPAAQPLFYFQSIGREFTAQALAELVAGYGGEFDSAGDVRVRCKTSRVVTPTGNSEAEHTFTPGSSDSYTFEFADAFGNSGSLAVDLSDYGIKLTAAPELDPGYVDAEAPIVDVDIYAKRPSTYEKAAAFLPKSDIGAAFTEAGYAAGYMIQVKASDRSAHKIVLLKSDVTTGLSYASAADDSVPGVSRTGNQISIDKDFVGAFTVAVVDEANNATAFTITADMVKSLFDTTPPTAETKLVVEGGNLYGNRVGYIRLNDESDDGTSTGTAALTYPSDLTLETSGDYDGWYRWSFTANGQHSFTFRDQAGNRSGGSIGVSGIDTSTPTLTATWSPSLLVTAADGTETANPASPPGEPVNRNVTAAVSSSVQLSEARISDGDKVVTLNKDKTAHADVDGWQAAFSSDGVAVTFTRDHPTGLSISVTGKNGIDSSIPAVLRLDGVIDKTAPTVDAVSEDVCLTGYSVPRAVKVALTPDEAVYFSGYGESGVQYSATKPLSVTFTENGSYTVRFTDLAGNTGRQTIMVAGIDRAAPVISVSETEKTVTLNEAGQVTFGDSPVSLEANQPHPLAFTENGVYYISARDQAGNESGVYVSIGSIDKTAPSILIDPLVVSIREGSDPEALATRLNGGYTVWDNMTAASALTLLCDSSSVKLDTVGTYTVAYTVRDEAGNVTTARRYVRVFSKDVPMVLIDGAATEPNGTAVISGLLHRLEVVGLKELTPGEHEPYTVKIARGIYAAGQMKNKNSAVAIAADGNLTFPGTGYYTVFVQTQSRLVYRTLVFIER